MKGVNKCYGLLLVLATIFGLSLSVSSDTSALKHQINTMPLYYYQYSLPGTSANLTGMADFDFSLVFTDSLPQGFDFSKTKSPYYFVPKLSNDTCVWNSSNVAYHSNYTGTWHSSENASTNIHPTYYGGWDVSSDTSSCSRLTPAIGDNMNWNSIPGNYNDFLYFRPYNYSYASYFYHDSREVDGVHYDSHGLSLDDILGSDNVYLMGSYSPRLMYIPIGTLHDIKSDDFVSVSNGTVLDFNYELFFMDYISYNGGLNDVSVDLKVTSVKSDGTYYPTQTISCPTHITEYSGDREGLSFSWSCHFVSPIDVYNGDAISFNYYIHSSNNHLWDFTFDSTGDVHKYISFYTDGLYVVTDYDDTPGGSIGGSTEGGDIKSAPGSVYDEYGSLLPEDADWFSSLSNLFNFNFINPFAPIFQLFSNNESCASIPTLASMLHSEETEVCPWFDSTTRGVVTPVLGLSSMMLVFGFAVRWLGSRSGNFVEDNTDGFDSGGIHVGRRKR